MPASRLWKKLHEDIYFIILSSIRRIHLDVCMFNYLCSCLKGKTFHIVDLYAVPTWKDKNVEKICFSFFFYHVLINRERVLLGIGTKVRYFCACTIFCHNTIRKT